MRATPFDTPPENSVLFGHYNQTMYGVPAPRFNPQPTMAFRQTRQPSPGANSYAFSTLGLVEFPYIGPGVANARQLRSVQTPPMYAGLGVIEVGIGGPNAGTMALTALAPNVWSGSGPVI